MREIYRKIASALIFSKDNKLLMGRKDPSGWWVYADCRHIPWGWMHEWETLKDTLYREILEEVGLDISPCEIEELPHPGEWTSEKVLRDTGEKVLCHMEFNRFKITVNQDANDITLKLSDDLVETKWFAMEELADVKQIPWGREFFQEMWYIK